MGEIVTEGGKGKGKHQKKRSKKVSTRVDFTPMVDLAFLLITFFMLTTTFSKPQTMEINMPVKDDKNQETQAVKESRAMTIILGPDDKVFWYTGIKDPDVQVTNFSKDGIRKILFDQLSRVRDMTGKESDLTVVIKAMESAKYKNVVDILDEMNITKVQRYALIDITPEDADLVKDKL